MTEILYGGRTLEELAEIYERHTVYETCDRDALKAVAEACGNDPVKQQAILAVKSCSISLGGEMRYDRTLVRAALELIEGEEK